jgi:hypothetical protein
MTLKRKWKTGDVPWEKVVLTETKRETLSVDQIPAL